MKKHILIFTGLALLSGCISADKYKKKEGELSSAQKALADCAAEKTAARTAADGLNAEVAAVNTQLDAAKAEIEALNKSNKDFQASLDAKKGELSKKVSELIQERDTLTQKLAASEQYAAALNKELEDEKAAALKQQTELAQLKQTKEQETLALAQDRDKALEEKKTVEAATQAELDRVKQAKEQEALALAKERDQALEEKKAAEAAKEAEIARVKKNYEDLTASLKSEIASGEITITQLKGKLTVNLVDRILFASGQAVVKADGKKVLERIGSVLGGVADKDIRIEGHTDNVPITGELKNKYPSNWELSTARATAVARYLQDTAKMDPRRLAAVGYGEYRPVAPNDTPADKALNRRIEIVLVPRD